MMWPLMTALKVSHRVKSDTSPISLVSKYSVIYLFIYFALHLQKGSSLSRKGRNCQTGHCLGFPKSRIIAVEARTEIKILCYGLVMLITWEPPLHSPGYDAALVGSDVHKWLEHVWSGVIRKVRNPSITIWPKLTVAAVHWRKHIVMWKSYL